MMEQRNERMSRQTEAEARCSAATAAASPALYLMRLFFTFCISWESIKPRRSRFLCARLPFWFLFIFCLSAAVFFFLFCPTFISIIRKQWLPCLQISTPVPASDPLRECFHPLCSCIPGICYCLVFPRFIEAEIGACVWSTSSFLWHRQIFASYGFICFDQTVGVVLEWGAGAFSRLKVKLIIDKLVLGIKVALWGV